VSKRVRQKAAPKPKRKLESELKVEWYSRDPGAESFALHDEQGKLRAQIKILDAPDMAEAIIAALTGKPKT
jgi:hypothetical protein